MESYGSNHPQAHSNGTPLVFPGCHMIKQSNTSGGVQRNTPHHQQCSHKLQNNYNMQSVLNSIIEVCLQHSKYLQPPKWAKQDMWQKPFKSSTSLSKKLLQRHHTWEDLWTRNWTKITDSETSWKSQIFTSCLCSEAFWKPPKWYLHEVKEHEI